MKKMFFLKSKKSKSIFMLTTAFFLSTSLFAGLSFNSSAATLGVAKKPAALLPVENKSQPSPLNISEFASVISHIPSVSPQPSPLNPSVAPSISSIQPILPAVNTIPPVTTPVTVTDEDSYDDGEEVKAEENQPQDPAPEEKTTTAEDKPKTSENGITGRFPGYELKGSCTTGFADSSSNRKTNISVASSKFNGLILEPGKEISVSQTFTPRTAANGYKSAGVYSGGKTVQGIGGGICQVSSTIYNAAMNSGLTITERHPHSMRVSYLPAALDAAISAGSKDLRIRNDYTFPVVFETYTKDNKLTVNVYTNADYTEGISYKLHSVSTGKLSADAYLEKTVNGQVVEDKYIGSSKYMPHG